MLRLLMLGILLVAADTAADNDALRKASEQAERAKASVQSALHQVEGKPPGRAETFDEALQRAGTLPASDFPMLERALADPEKLASIGTLMEDAKTLAAALHEARATEGRVAVYLFASFSMPDASLRALIRQGELVGVPIVLRGLIDDSVEATMQRVHGLYDQQERQETGVLIDPTLFARFAIDQVPTVVVAEAAAGACTQETCPIPRHVKIAGDVPLRYALDRIARAKPAYRDELRPMMAALEPGRHW